MKKGKLSRKTYVKTELFGQEKLHIFQKEQKAQYSSDLGTYLRRKFRQREQSCCRKMLMSGGECYGAFSPGQSGLAARHASLIFGRVPIS